MATIKTDLICNLNQPVNVTYLHGNLFSQDNAGNTINVFVMDNGEPATIGGTVSANVIRSDGQTVAVSGAIEGNKAYVILPQACYAVPGVVHIIIKLTQNTTVTTIAAIVANVYMSTTDAVIDPGQVIPSIQALMALIEEAVDSIPTDYTGLLHTIAADYSSSKTYKVGDYAWESGVLKRCIVPITASETYTAAHWTNAVIGDDLTNLKSALCTAETEIYVEFAEVVDFGVNQYNKNSPEIIVGTWIASNGTVNENAGTGYALSHPIFVEKGITYKYYDSYSQFGNNGLCVYYVDDNLKVTKITNAQSDTSTTATFTAEQTGYIRFNVHYSAHNADVIFAKESEYPNDAYSAFSRTLKGNKINGLSVNEEQTTFFSKVNSANLFNKSNIERGYYFNLANGNLVSSTNQYASYVVHNGAGDYYYKVNADFFSTNAVKICLFDSNKTYLKTLVGTAQESASSNMLTKVTLSESDASASKYFGYTHGISYLNVDMFVKGDAYPQTYIPFEEYYTIPNFKLISENVGYEVEKNPLIGKKISLNGDSICAGAGYAGGYGGIIATNNGMQLQNIAVGGATITAETYYQDQNPRHWICRTISSMDSDADYAIVEGGINDSVATGGIGTISSGYTAELDDTTFCGAFESMLKQLVTRFAGKKVGYIAVHKATQYFSSNTTNPTIDYYGKAIECCKKWGVPVCDLNIECPPLGYIDTLKNAYTSNGDGWHPNESGYKNYYVPKITAWLKTL